MPYRTGKTPMIGDYIANTAGRKGIATKVQQSVGQLADDILTVKWDDGVVEIENYSAGSFELISRGTTESTSLRIAKRNNIPTLLPLACLALIAVPKSLAKQTSVVTTIRMATELGQGMVGCPLRNQ